VTNVNVYLNVSLFISQPIAHSNRALSDPPPEDAVTTEFGFEGKEMFSKLSRPDRHLAYVLCVILMLPLTGTEISAAQAETVISMNNRSVAICVESVSQIWIEIMQAQAQASLIFGEIGIRIEWHDYYRDCPAALNPIRIRLVMDTHENELPGALAFSQPFEGIHVRIFYDRVRRAAETRRVRSLFGHVLAHEIAHMLQGSDRHSEIGVMKARWTADDYAQMDRQPLSFDKADLMLLDRGLERRSLRYTALGSATEGLVSRNRR
jgi:hypothetical protein